MLPIYVVRMTKEHEHDGQETTISLYSTVVSANRAARTAARKLHDNLDGYDLKNVAPVEEEMVEGLYSAEVEIEDGLMAYFSVERKEVGGPDSWKGEVDSESEVDEDEDQDQEDEGGEDKEEVEGGAEAAIPAEVSRDSSIEIVEPSPKRARVG